MDVYLYTKCNMKKQDTELILNQHKMFAFLHYIIKYKELPFVLHENEF